MKTLEWTIKLVLILTMLILLTIFINCLFSILYINFNNIYNFTLTS